MTTEEILKKFESIIIVFGPKLIGAALVLIVGLIVVRLLKKGFSKVLDKRNIDASLKPFLKSIIGVLLKLLLIITVLSMLGIQMASFVAIIAAAGLAIGMALSGTLQNFAGGVMILLFKPFKVGDFIDAEGYNGTVNEIQIFNTILKTPDNKTIILPNGKLANSPMTNYSTESLRRVDWKIGIGYGDDAKKAKEVIRNMVEADERVLKEPAVFIALSELGDSSVNFAVRAWVKAPDYWGVFFYINEQVYKDFDKAGLNIPFPQMDVHVHQQKRETI